MSQEEFNAVAQRIIKARADTCATGPISADYPHFGMDDAYAVQQLVNRDRLEKGGRITGYKIGLTSEAVQQQLGVDQPDYGVLFADMERRSGELVDCSQLIAPKAEGEIGFVFKNDLDCKDLTFTELLAEIDCFMPVVEIVDSVVRDWKINIVDTVADNASSALYLVGSRRFDPAGVDFTRLTVAVEAEGMDTISGTGAACLGNPLNATWWLARKLIDLGTPIKKGHLVLSGAMAPMVNIRPGEQLKFSFEQLGDLVLNAG
ncbi:MAG: 2-keto-4-pentenoate hydratase [Oceanospirillales bacterium]|uniref:2-keto-4-pentenoate hydratase n=1 Tax=Marinobacterium halophilum TaxID=267374 RepID=A0A2P8ERJ6_9GAMM|nr:fumarylacetoacetate hydrolase family protein [Marinobacterium halophilum]MBR9829543.1 2-keto-4-pentenoate hydratase [Oceanospirillales bacterium]PSL12091.1 2-keto-4-pentenoate hydratase [Marinobacterium halophilum]